MKKVTDPQNLYSLFEETGQWRHKGKEHCNSSCLNLFIPAPPPPTPLPYIFPFFILGRDIRPKLPTSHVPMVCLWLLSKSRDPRVCPPTPPTPANCLMTVFPVPGTPFQVNSLDPCLQLISISLLLLLYFLQTQLPIRVSV